MGLESYKQLNINFINKLIKTEDNKSNLDELIHNKLEDEDDLSKLESKVDVYLSKIKELDSFLCENEEDKLNNNNKYEKINRKIKEFVSLEKEHQSGPYNRHVYFAGIPLKNSLEVLNNLKIIKNQKEQILRLEDEVKILKEELAELSEEKKVNFERFEVSIQKALRIGLGVQILINSFNNFNFRRLRLFFIKLRHLNYHRLHLQVNKLSSLKALSLAHVLNNLIKSRLYSSFYRIKFTNNLSIKHDRLVTKDNLSIQDDKLIINNNRINMDIINKDNMDIVIKDKHEDIEKNLLNRLEKLLIEEINMLSR